MKFSVFEYLDFFFSLLFSLFCYREFGALVLFTVRMCSAVFYAIMPAFSECFSCLRLMFYFGGQAIYLPLLRFNPFILLQRKAFTMICFQLVFLNSGWICLFLASPQQGLDFNGTALIIRPVLYSVRRYEYLQ